MANPDKWLGQLEDTLSAMRVDVSRVEQTLNVKAGRGITASKANIDPAPLWPVLEEAGAAHQRRLIAGYANGVKHVLLEPKRSKAAEWDFLEAAGRLMPNVEVHTFALGAEAAAGDAPWTIEFHEDLILAYYIELDMGIRLLTEGQFDAWSAPEGRVTAGARSMLYAKSRDMKPSRLDDFEQVEKIHTGDEYDAVRSIVIADIFFAEFDDDFKFSMPSQNALLFTRGDSEAELDELRDATDQYFDDADYPLSRSIYGFSAGAPILDEERAP